MARVKTFANGGSLLPGDLNSIEDDYEFAFSTYKELLVRSYTASGLSTGAVLELVAPTASYGFTTSSGGPVEAHYFDPADYTGNTRTTKYRVRASLLTNGVAPTSTFTVGLYPVTASAGASGNIQLTNGAVVAGSTVAFAAPSASSENQGNSGDFTAPAAGYFGLAVTLTVAGMAAGSLIALSVRLQMRQV